MVSAEQFEQALAKIRAEALLSTGDPRFGLFGPGSLNWKVNRETVLLLGGGAAALLQLAHPFVAQAVHEHSRVQRDVAGRFRRTFARLLVMVFGDLDGALRSARRVRAIHDQVQGRFEQPVGCFSAGSAYQANDAGAMFWVQATLLDTAMKVYSELVEPLSPKECQDFYEGGKSLSLLFGLLPEQLPRDYADFTAYYANFLRSNTLSVGPAARELATHILTPPNAAVRPVYRFIRAYTAALLPEDLRRAFGLPYGRAERMLLLFALPAVRTGLLALPPWARYFPAYLDAQRRLFGQKGGDVESRRLARRLLPLLRPSFVLRDLLR
jgi:uncharacterized protein (DUF2236 family)